MTNPNIWAPGTSISANSSIRTQSFEASASQSVFTLTSFTYEVGTGSLYVYVSGLMQRPSIDFFETAANTFTLSTPVQEGTIVLAVATVEVSAVLDQTFVVSDYYNATGGETVVTWGNFQYDIGGNHLRVFRNGLLQEVGYDYTETSNNSVTFLTALEDGDRITFLSNVFYTESADGNLRGDLLSSGGSNLVGYTQGGTGAVARNVQEKLREWVSVLDFGADPTGDTDSRASIQAALDYALANDKEVFFPSGTYSIQSVGSTISGVVTGLNSYNQTGIYQYNYCAIRGEGPNATQITCSDTLAIDALFFAKHNGAGFQAFDIGFSVPGGSATKTCLKLAGNSITVERIKTSGGLYGIHAQGEMTISDHNDEYSNNALRLSECYFTRVSNSFYLTNNPSGVTVYGTNAGSVEGDETKALSGIEFVNCSFGQTVAEYTCVTVDVEAAANMAVSFTNCFFGGNGFSTGGGGTPYPGYGLLVSESGLLSFTGCQFTLTKYGNIISNADHAVFTGCVFEKSGFLTSTNWATRDLAIAGNSRVTVQGCTFKESAGNAIYATSCKNLSLIGNTFLNVSNGGLNGSNVRVNAASATVGDENIYWKPSATSDVLRMVGNHFDAPAAYTAGKTGLTIDCATAVPADGNVVITGNTRVASSFGADFTFSGGSYTTASKALWRISDDQLVTSEWTTPAFSAGNFTSDSGSWTVESGDVATYKYKIIDKMMFLVWEIRTTDVTGTPAQLRIAIPASKVSVNSEYAYAFSLDNGTRAFAVAIVDAGGTYVRIHKATPAFANWTATGGAADTYVYGNITFEIQ